MRVEETVTWNQAFPGEDFWYPDKMLELYDKMLELYKTFIDTFINHNYSWTHFLQSPCWCDQGHKTFGFILLHWYKLSTKPHPNRIYWSEWWTGETLYVCIFKYICLHNNIWERIYGSSFNIASKNITLLEKYFKRHALLKMDKGCLSTLYTQKIQ